MTVWDDPNRQAVGLDPAWVEGTGGEVGSGEASPEPKSKSGVFDPGEHTVAEVEDYLAANPAQADAVLAAEKAGKNRTSLTGD